MDYALETSLERLNTSLRRLHAGKRNLRTENSTYTINPADPAAQILACQKYY